MNKVSLLLPQHRDSITVIATGIKEDLPKGLKAKLDLLKGQHFASSVISPVDLHLHQRHFIKKGCLNPLLLLIYSNGVVFFNSKYLNEICNVQQLFNVYQRTLPNQT